MRSDGGPGQRPQITPPSGGTQRNVSVTSSVRSHSTQRSTSGRWPSSSARCISYQRATRPAPSRRRGARRARRSSAYMARASWRSSRLRSAISARYQAVAALSRLSRSRSQAWPTLTSVTTSNVRPRASAMLSSANGSRLPPRRRAADPLGDGLELADLGGDQRQDAVRLAQVEPGEDDGIGDVSTRRGHGPTVALRGWLVRYPGPARALTRPDVPATQARTHVPATRPGVSSTFRPQRWRAELTGSDPSSAPAPGN